MANNTLSQKNIVGIFKDIAINHKKLETFYYGKLDELDSNIKYPLLVVQPNTSILQITDNQKHGVIQYSFTLTFFDKLNKSQENLLDVVSNTFLLGSTYVSYIKQHRMFMDLQMHLVDDVGFEPVVNKTSDDVIGQECVINIQVPNRYTPCNSPIEPITGWSTEFNYDIQNYFYDLGLLRGESPIKFEKVGNEGIISLNKVASGTHSVGNTYSLLQLEVDAWGRIINSTTTPITTELPDIITASTIGSTVSIPVISYDSKGRITNTSSAAISTELPNVIVAGIIGTSHSIPTISYDSKGRIISSSDNNIDNLYLNNSTGIISQLTINQDSTTAITINEFTGIIVDDSSNNQEVINITFPTQSIEIPVTTALATYVLVDKNAGIVLQSTYPTSAQRRQNIFICKVGHGNMSTITAVIPQPDFTRQPISQLRDMFQPIQFINDGVYISANNDLTINLSEGNIHGLGINYNNNMNSPNEFFVAAADTPSFYYRTQNGGTEPSTQFIRPNYFDNAGTVTLITGNFKQTTNQRVYYVPNAGIIIQYGQTIYNTMTDAIIGLRTEQFNQYSNLIENAILIAIITLQIDCTDLSNADKALILLVDKFGQTVGAQGGISTATLQQAYNNSAQPSILVNSINGTFSLKNGNGTKSNLLSIVDENNNTNAYLVSDGSFVGKTASFTTLNINNKQVIIQDGNTLGTTVSIGTNDNQAVSIKTNNVSRLDISSDGTLYTFRQATTLTSSDFSLNNLTRCGSNLGVSVGDAGVASIPYASSSSTALLIRKSTSNNPLFNILTAQYGTFSRMVLTAAGGLILNGTGTTQSIFMGDSLSGTGTTQSIFMGDSSIVRTGGQLAITANTARAYRISLNSSEYIYLNSTLGVVMPNGSKFLAYNSFKFLSIGGGQNITVGTFSALNLDDTFNVTSGTGNYIPLLINNIYNQTGTSTGNTRGIQISQTGTFSNNYIALDIQVPNNITAQKTIRIKNNLLDLFTVTNKGDATLSASHSVSSTYSIVTKEYIDSVTTQSGANSVTINARNGVATFTDSIGPNSFTNFTINNSLATNYVNITLANDEDGKLFFKVKNISSGVITVQVHNLEAANTTQPIILYFTVK